ncbi:hypothetical protein [Alloactinosynnema sp. L-07]|uniref:Mom family adenine methylcarbamoylation protein n=1 Tax=Alloactinosynnema sp. L-07 TaxID=1653480 RepID=UPI00065F082F|nr:hypothetical protein [Alloactinosynnema sp. L-07]CRK56924.1 hypothetical protein [Alloactinosynnema sp. L-07]
MPPYRTQRWTNRIPTWRPAHEGGFDPDRYEVIELDELTARRFIARHHYAPTLPSTTLRYGMIDHGTDMAQLVGVATFGVPMSRGTLTNVFPTLEPYTETLDFNRLVLRDDVLANGESFFCAAAFRMASRDHGLRGVVTFADPIPRWRVVGGRHELIKPGHVGIVYQALNFAAIGRSSPRTLVLLPDATVLTARAIAKVTSGERGARGVVDRLVAFGAPPPDSLDFATDGRLPGPVDSRQDRSTSAQWLRVALREIGARRIRHPGNFRYALRLGTRAQRTRTVIAMQLRPYPKPDLALTVA